MLHLIGWDIVNTFKYAYSTIYSYPDQDWNNQTPSPPPAKKYLCPYECEKL